MENKYDVAIIGGGPAGYLAAERAAQAGLAVVLFEKQSLGGVCLNEGCIPTKTLLYSAKLYQQAKYSEEYGVTAKEVDFDQQKVINRKNKVVKLLVAGVNAKLKKHNVLIINAPAFIKGKVESAFELVADNTSYFSDYLLIASGSQSITPNITGMTEALASGFVLSNKEILQLTTLPESLLIIGGGVIGLEMASYFNSVGVTVTVVEMLPSIGGNLDSEISAFLLKELQKKGIEFKLGFTVKEIADKTIIAVRGEETIKLDTDLVLLAVGRKAVTVDLGLENLSVYCEKGAIVTDEQLQTNVPRVYAIGDVNGKSMLAHTAYREAEVAVNHILGKFDTMRYEAVPAVIYGLPEVGVVGESEKSAKEKGLDFVVKKLSLRYSGRFIAENEKSDGLCKVLIEKSSQRIIGVHILGSYASEIIYGAALMIESQWNFEDFKELIFPHPTVSEIIRETLYEESLEGED